MRARRGAGKPANGTFHMQFRACLDADQALHFSAGGKSDAGVIVCAPVETTPHFQTSFTFVFTDIEGSSRLWEENPETMALALARHDVAPLVRKDNLLFAGYFLDPITIG